MRLPSIIMLRRPRSCLCHSYAWYYMPASVHKVLIHGSAIVSASLLPIGQLSEEARNKDIKKFREHYKRSLSRESINLDLVRMLMLT
jgi:hypothetical protein